MEVVAEPLLGVLTGCSMIKPVTYNHKTKRLYDLIRSHDVRGKRKSVLYYGTRTSQMRGEYIPTGERYWMIILMRVGTSRSGVPRYQRDEIIALGKTISESVGMLQN
jgi:hypothetical protein